MRTEIAKIVIEIFKLAPRYLVTLGIVAAFLLFSREDILKWLGIFDFTQKYRQWLGLTLVITVVLFAVDRTVPIIRWVRNKMLGVKIRNKIRKSCKNLTEDEKQILRFYIFKEKKTNFLHSEDGVVTGLESKRIIRRAANIGNTRDGFSYNINEIAWAYLKKNPQVLEGTSNIARTDKFSYGM